jgi:hypothetical protein
MSSSFVKRSLSSTINFCAVFLPIPGVFASNTSSSLATKMLNIITDHSLSTEEIIRQALKNK